MLRAEIQFEYPGFSLQVSLEAGAGITVLFGPSGAGKTMTLDAIAGFVRPERGLVALGERVLFDASKRVDVAVEKRGIGYVVQQGGLFPHMSLLENVRFGAPRMSEQEALTLLARLGIDALAKRYPRQMSGGQQQRGVIARALASEPGVLLLDEPTRGLDAQRKREFHELLRELQERAPVPMLLVTHDLEECLALADRMYLLDAGRVMAEGRPANLLESPPSVRAARLLGQHHVMEVELGEGRVRSEGVELAARGVRGQGKAWLAYRPHEMKASAASTGLRALSKTLSTQGYLVMFEGGFVAQMADVVVGGTYALELQRSLVEVE